MAANVIVRISEPGTGVLLDELRFEAHDQADSMNDLSQKIMDLIENYFAEYGSVETDPENIYGSDSMRQSVEEERK